MLLTDSAGTIALANRAAALAARSTPAELAGRALDDVLQFAPVPVASTGVWREARFKNTGQAIEVFSVTLPEADARLHVIKSTHAAGAMQATLNTDPTARLAAGIAHDFNNFLTVIGGNLQLAEARLKDQRVQHLLREANLACAMAARQIGRLLTFAGHQKLKPAALDLNTVVHDMIAPLSKTTDERVVIALDLSSPSPVAMADRSELESALLNILLNALDAMPDGGTLSLSTAERDTPSGRMAFLTVSDTGTGMPDHVLARACEPFFSTKSPDAGSGLGLAMVDGFVRQSGGAVEITSQAGAGTSVTLLLPAAGMMV